MVKIYSHICTNLWIEMAIYPLKQIMDLYRNPDTPVYIYVPKKQFACLNRWTLPKKFIYRKALLQISKLFIYWYRELEFMVKK